MGVFYYVIGVIGVGLLTTTWLLLCFRKWLKLRAELMPETVYPRDELAEAAHAVPAPARRGYEKIAA